MFGRTQNRLKNEADEQSLFTARALQALLVVAVCLVLLLLRFAWLQVIAHEEYTAKSESNRIRMRAIAPPRGLIFDRNGLLLAENQLAYRLELVPEQARKIEGGIDAIWERLSQIVALDEDARGDFEKSRKQHRHFEGVPIKLRLSEEEVARINVALFRLPGILISPYLTRQYPYGPEFAHVLGYVGRISVDDLQRLDVKRYEGTSYIGKTGIEAYYEPILHGIPGYERVEVDAAGRTVRVLKRVLPKAGKNLVLSVDADLQRAVMLAYGEQTGAAVAIDPDNGSVLAFVSMPSFDPNLFVNGISQRNYRALLDNPLQPTFNRALNGTYPPGSTFKPFMAMAGLELGLRTPESTVYSSGTFYLQGDKRGYRDWRAGGHGVVNLHESMAQSVNTYFYQLAFELGIDRMHDYMQQFGLGSRTGLDLLGESSGLMPNRAWKQRVKKQAWFPGETVVCGIGQGQISVTLVQLAHASAVLAAAGVSYKPSLLLAIEDPVTGLRESALKPPVAASFIKNVNNVISVHDSMKAVLHGPTGTARAVGAGSAYWMAGKTGTAQQVAIARRPVAGAASSRFKNQALFVGFAPAELAPGSTQARIAVGLVVEQGGSGAHAAAPVARAIFDSYLVDGKRLLAESARAGSIAYPVERAPALVDPDAALEALEAEVLAAPIQPRTANPDTQVPPL